MFNVEGIWSKIPVSILWEKIKKILTVMRFMNHELFMNKMKQGERLCVA